MSQMRVIEVKESIFANNDEDAARLRMQLKDEKTFLLNMMSSPGSGKTTTLVKTINALSETLILDIKQNGNHYHQVYHRGVPEDRLAIAMFS